MRKIALLLALLLTLSLLAGCAHMKHEWTEATCTEPETCTVGGETRGEPLGHHWVRATCTEPARCSRCGETRGEPLGHQWAEGSCTEPRTCAVCGATEGEAPGHQWQEADCTHPKTCTVCGATEGEALGHDAPEADYWHASVCSRCGEEVAPALTPDFVAYGLDDKLIELDKTYDYRTVCYENKSAQTVGHLRVVSYETTKGDGAKLAKKKGYEWRCVTLEILFDDDNANSWGMSIGTSIEDYYDVRRRDDSTVEGEDSTAFQVFWNGKTYDCLYTSSSSFSGWENRKETWTWKLAFQVPKGYDGCVVGVRNRAVEWPDGKYIIDLDNSDSLFFRLN